jgi:hypothetical protein
MVLHFQELVANVRKEPRTGWVVVSKTFGNLELKPVPLGTYFENSIAVVSWSIHPHQGLQQRGKLVEGEK